MIGVIVTGHGNFASGIYSSVKLLAGKPEHFLAVDFTLEDTTDDIEYKLRDAIRDIGCDDILILSDLVNGTPYKESLEMQEKFTGKKNIEIVTGVNLGMVLQINLARGYVVNVQDLADLAVEEGKRQIFRYERG